MKMIDVISSFFATNILWLSAAVLVVTVAIIAHGIFAKQKDAAHEEFFDAEYLMEDDAFTPRHDA